MSRKLAGWVALTQALSCPALFFATYTFVQTEGMTALFGIVDRSQDLSGVRFHTTFSEAIELDVHCCSIISAPLHILVMCSAFSVLRKGNVLRTMIRAVGGIAAGSLVFHFICVIFGAPVVDAWAKTLAFSVYLASLAAVPMACILGADVVAWVRIVSCSEVNDRAELVAYVAFATAVVGAWIGAFPIPLDWDEPWQAWPITCTVGATVAQTVGLLGLAAYLLLGAEAKDELKQD